MASTEFDADLFERKLQALKDSQDSIQGLSSWCLENRAHHKKIVAIWLQVLKKVKVEHRLTLFYLANDVIQYSKRKNFEFVESWGTTLQRATTMVREEKVKHRILRIFKIWEQRQIYDEEFLADLSGLISAAPKKKTEPQTVTEPDEFQAALLISTMRSCATLEQITDARLRDLRDGSIDLDNIEEICTSLKDRRHVEDVEREVDIAVGSVENYVKALEAEIKERSQVLELLEQADQFYETQRSEVKMVTNAYRYFGSRIKNLKKKLEELIPMLASPLPSPDINAPSPSPDSDIDLPGEDNQTINQSSIIDVAPPSLYGSYAQDYEQTNTSDQAHGNASSDFTPNFSSFMGGNMDFDMRNLFNDRSVTPIAGNQQYDPLEAKSIEVIDSRQEGSTKEDFEIPGFLNNVLPLERPSNIVGIPGLGLDTTDNVTITSPQRADYGHSPAIGPLPTTTLGTRSLTSQGTPPNNPQIVHSTPLPIRTLNMEPPPPPYSNHNSQTAAPFESLPVTPLPPPPLPPSLFLDDETCYNKLPPKFPTWAPANEVPSDPVKWNEKEKNSMNPTWPGDEKNKNQWSDTDNNQWDQSSNANWNVGIRNKSTLSETPESPPLYEKTGFTNPVEYNDSQEADPLLGSVGDVDHRILQVPLPLDTLPHRVAKAADVDHRNLISLTGSPANNSSANDTAATVNDTLWSNTDQDYRIFVDSTANTESVEMEISVSDDEGDCKPKNRGVSEEMKSDIVSQMENVNMIQLPPGEKPCDSGKSSMLPRGEAGLTGGKRPPGNPGSGPMPFQSGPPGHPSMPFMHNNVPDMHRNEFPNYPPGGNNCPPGNPRLDGPDYGLGRNDTRFHRTPRGRGGRRPMLSPYKDSHIRPPGNWSGSGPIDGGGHQPNLHLDAVTPNRGPAPWAMSGPPNSQPMFDDLRRQGGNLRRPPTGPHPGCNDGPPFDRHPNNEDSHMKNQSQEMGGMKDCNPMTDSNEPPKHGSLSEELEAMMGQRDEMLDDAKDMPEMSNGSRLQPQPPPPFESPQQHNFRPRAPMWRPGGMRNRGGGFRGNARGWMDNRGPRMMSPGFSPRGRGGRGGFRGNRGGRW